jgi:molecular chaperone GrpE
MAIDPRLFTADPARSTTSDEAPHAPSAWRERAEPAAAYEPATHDALTEHESPVPEPLPRPGTLAAMAAPVSADAGTDRQAALRALRNLEATEARLERNARREAEETRAKLVQELLPVLDNLDRTIRAAEAGRGDPGMLEGVRMVRQQLEGVLRGYGVERIEALGHRFDPALHDAIGMVSVGEPQRHGVVVQQAEPGYRFAGRLLRPAKVSVGKLVSPPAFHPVAWR